MENKYNWLIQTREYLLDSWHGGEKKKVMNFKERIIFFLKLLNAVCLLPKGMTHYKTFS